ncbi:hypothetical protein Gotur_005473 [Gossypium turneri]
MIHTDIGNKMVAAKVNGNLVSPTHVLANAEVVEIITYNDSEMEDLSHSSRQNRPLWEKILKNIVDFSTPGRSSEDALTAKNGMLQK